MWTRFCPTVSNTILVLSTKEMMISGERKRKMNKILTRTTTKRRKRINLQRSLIRARASQRAKTKKSRPRLNKSLNVRTNDC